MPGKLDRKKQKAGEVLAYRSLAVRLDSEGRPASIDEKARSVEVVGASESPVLIYDYGRGAVVNEVLLMDGAVLPANRQVVLIDTHDYYGGTSSVLGSYRGIEIEGDRLVGRAHFSNAPEAGSPWLKLSEGHLTDFSVGYRQIKSEWIPEGETRTINGRSFDGPLLVTTQWRLKELSICPIGADEQAKARNDAGEIKPNPKECFKMNEALRKYLESKGLKVDADEAEAYRYLNEIIGRGEVIPPLNEDGTPIEAAPATPADPVVVEVRTQADEGAVRAEAAEIAEMARTLGIEDKVGELVALSLVDANKRALAIVAERRQTEAVRTPAQIVTEESDKFRAAAYDGLLLRAGVDVEKPAEGADTLRGVSLVQICAEGLRLRGERHLGDAREIVGRALMTSDLQNLFANVANKELARGFEIAPETYETWADTSGSIGDFKQLEIPRASEFDDLDEIPERGSYEYGEISDAKEVVQLATFGKKFAITRQALINDDLGAITTVPLKMGNAAKRKIGDVVYAVLTANSAMGDGKALFHADHGNMGTGGIIGLTTSAEAVKLVGVQTDLSGNAVLNLRPEYFIAPKAVEGAAEIFFKSERFDNADAGATRVNPYAGAYFTRVYDARLDGVSATAWYMAARKGMGVKVFFLNGIKKPFMEQKEGWDVDGVEYKVRIDAAAKALDWVGLFYNAGA